MADEAELITINAATDSWVDLTPGAVSTGYQAQNTNIEANRFGFERVRIEPGSGEVTVKAGSTFEANGLMFSVPTDFTLTIPGGTGPFYLHATAGTDSTLKTITIVADRGTYDAALGARYSSGNRVLNPAITLQDGLTDQRMVLDFDYDGLAVNNVPIYGVEIVTSAPALGSMVEGVLYLEEVT